MIEDNAFPVRKGMMQFKDDVHPAQVSDLIE